MNTSYRSIWNESLGAWVAASELTSARGKKSGSTCVAMAVGVLLAVGMAGAGAQIVIGVDPLGNEGTSTGTDTNAIAIGNLNVLGATPNAIAVGAGNTVGGGAGTVGILGGGNTVTTSSSISVNGVGNTLTFAKDAGVFGNNNTATTTETTSLIGSKNTTNAVQDSLAIGSQNQLFGSQSVSAIGGLNVAMGSAASSVTGIGNILTNSSASSISGIQNKIISTTALTPGTLSLNSVQGYNNILTDSTQTNVQGANNTVTNGKQLFVAGFGNTLGAGMEGNQILASGGTVAAATTGGVLIGIGGTLGASDTVAIGTGAQATLATAVALGSGSVASVAGGALGFNPSNAGGVERAAIQATNSTTLGAVSVGTGAVGGNRQIVNVAAGTNDADAVNVAQLKGVVATAVANNEYTDARVNLLTDGINNIAKKAYSGVASAMAMESAPFIAGKVTYAVGAGYYQSQGALGISLRKTADNGRWSVGGGVSASPAGGVAARIGISGIFN